MKRILLIAAGLVLVAVLVMGAYLINWFKRYDLYFNPVVTEVWNAPGQRKWGDRVALTPNLFQIGDTRDSVLRTLDRSGFERTEKIHIWKPLQQEIEQGHEVYFREANRFPCNTNMFVVVGFEENLLTLADGAQQERGCL